MAYASCSKHLHFCRENGFRPWLRPGAFLRPAAPPATTSKHCAALRIYIIEQEFVHELRRRSIALIHTLIAKVFGTHNEREIKRLMPRVARINALEPEIKK